MGARPLVIAVIPNPHSLRPDKRGLELEMRKPNETSLRQFRRIRQRLKQTPFNSCLMEIRIDVSSANPEE